MPRAWTSSSRANSVQTMLNHDCWSTDAAGHHHHPSGYRITVGVVGDAGRTVPAYYCFAPSGGFVGATGGELALAFELCDEHAQKQAGK